MKKFYINQINEVTIMSNHHLKNHELSLEAKGLMSSLLNYRAAQKSPLNYINILDLYVNEKKLDLIIQELEEHGYLIVCDILDKKGILRQRQYIIIESPN